MWIARLSSGLPALNAAPVLPPLRKAATVSMFRSPCGSFLVWQRGSGARRSASRRGESLSWRRPRRPARGQRIRLGGDGRGDEHQGQAGREKSVVQRLMARPRQGGKEGPGSRNCTARHRRLHRGSGDIRIMSTCPKCCLFAGAETVSFDARNGEWHTFPAPSTADCGTRLPQTFALLKGGVRSPEGAQYGSPGQRPGCQMHDERSPERAK